MKVNVYYNFAFESEDQRAAAKRAIPDAKETKHEDLQYGHEIEISGDCAEIMADIASMSSLSGADHVYAWYVTAESDELAGIAHADTTKAVLVQPGERCMIEYLGVDEKDGVGTYAATVEGSEEPFCLVRFVDSGVLPPEVGKLLWRMMDDPDAEWTDAEYDAVGVHIPEEFEGMMFAF